MDLKIIILLIFILIFSGCNSEKNQILEINEEDFKILQINAKGTSDKLIGTNQDEIIYTIVLENTNYTIDFKDIKIELFAKNEKQTIIFDIFATDNYFYLLSVEEDLESKEGKFSNGGLVEIHFVPSMQLSEGDTIKLDISHKDILFNSDIITIPLMIQEVTKLK